MRLSCELFPKVCQSCAAQKSLIPTLPANTETTILKEGWRSCAWQRARQCPGSEFSRALAACLDTEAGCGVLPKDLAGTDVAPERGHGLVTRLLHDDELAHAVHRRLGHASGAEGVPAEWINVHSGPSCSSLQELSNRVFVQAASRDMSIAADRPEDGTVGDFGSGEPLPERADRTRFLTGTEGQSHFASCTLLVRLRSADGDDDTVRGELQVIYMDTGQLRTPESSRESGQNQSCVSKAKKVLTPGGDDPADVCGKSVAHASSRRYRNRIVCPALPLVWRYWDTASR
jgi:hypothetical protein